MSSITAFLADVADTPANRSVLELLRWATGPTAPTDAPAISVVASEAGALRPDFAAATDLYVVNDGTSRRPSSTLQGLGLHRPAEVARSRELRRRIGGGHDTIWVADLRAGRLLAWAGPARRVVVHQHGAAPAPALDAEDAALLAARATAWLAGSTEAADRLRAALPDAPPPDLVPDFVRLDRLWPEVAATTRSERRAATRAALRDRFGTPVDVPLVVGGGSVDFWHASNSWVQACWDVRMADPQLGTRFAWLAESSTDRMLWPLRHDLAHAGLEHVASIVGPEIPAFEVLAAADVHVRTGRHPLTPLEASELLAAAAPIVAFEDPTMPADVRARAAVVGWLDLHAMRDEVLRLVRTPAGPTEPTDDACRWDVRFGGAALLHALAGPTA